jgi:hypothetical protein
MRASPSLSERWSQLNETGAHDGRAPLRGPGLAYILLPVRAEDVCEVAERMVDDAEPREEAAPREDDERPAAPMRPAVRADETLFAMEWGEDGAALRIGLPSDAGSPAGDEAKAGADRAIMQSRAVPVSNERRIVTMCLIMRVSFQRVRPAREVDNRAVEREAAYPCEAVAPGRAADEPAWLEALALRPAEDDAQPQAAPPVMACGCDGAALVADDPSDAGLPATDDAHAEPENATHARAATPASAERVTKRRALTTLLMNPPLNE